MERIQALRALLTQKNVQGFILPVGDEYLSEYPPARAERLKWLTGFSGSAGTAAVIADEAALFTDGRYMLQAAAELEGSLYHIHNISDMTIERWLKETLQAQGIIGARIGFDPRLHSVKDYERLRGPLKDAGAELIPLVPNPIDSLWQDRPALSSVPAWLLSLEVAGESAEAKIARILEKINETRADALLLAAPDSVNWLLNIRAHDVEFTPILLASALVEKDGKVTLYADEAKIPPEVRAALPQVNFAPVEALEAELHSARWGRKKLWIDAQTTPYWYAHLAQQEGAEMVYASDPCALPKACKNAAELAGMRRAHIEDGAAVATFFCWLEGQASVSEMEAAERLLAFRKERAGFLFPSFATIAGSGPNGAIVHYRASEKSNRTLGKNELFLLDSGGQYSYGTTDITRTIAIGTPASGMIDAYTRVLKGHIALATVRFPKGTTGSQLDILARQYLWQAGLDYDHGTGHGVGCALSVHEGPQRISKRPNDVSLSPGMVCSNEPGYYKAGAFGIRIENLVVVKEDGCGEGDVPYFCFETITCAPIDTRLVDARLLEREEIRWLNGYHAWVEATLSPMLGEAERAWLKKACGEIK